MKKMMHQSFCDILVQVNLKSDLWMKKKKLIYLLFLYLKIQYKMYNIKLNII